jgi:flagellin
MVINTNLQAQQTANNLNASSTALAKSLSRLSSGSKIVAPSDDAAGLAVSSRLTSQMKRLDAAINNVVSAVSFTQTQDGFLKTIDKAFRRMGELAMLAQDPTKSTDDLILYNQEYKQLAEYIDKARDQTFNSVPLFSADAMNVTIDSEGSTFAMEGIDLSVLDSGISGDIETMASAQTALGDIKTAIGDLAQLRASLGAVQSRLNFTAEQLMVSKENLSAAISNISDTDVAQEATAFARYQILVESGTSMLAQANKMPQSALSLLRQ